MVTGSKAYACMLFLLLLAFRLTAFARIPEPDTILVGSLATADGESVVNAGQAVVVRAVVDGVTLAKTNLSQGDSGKFVLRVPMDDGVAPRIPGTAKTSDRIRIVVDNTSSGISEEVEETKSGGVEIPAGRGNVLSLSFSVTANLAQDDVNANGIPDEWERKYAEPKNGYEGISLARDDSSGDNDGDGLSNREEWISGTDPLDETSVFTINSFMIESGKLNIGFLPVVAGRTYMLQQCTDLSADPEKRWVTVETLKATESKDSFAWEFAAPEYDACLYRITVEVTE